jgi:hypothetical protein
MKPEPDEISRVVLQEGRFTALKYEEKSTAEDHHHFAE